jgi:predicted RNase H-like HicB family nuclease
MRDRTARPPLGERLIAGMEEALQWAKGETQGRVTIVDDKGRRFGPEMMTRDELRERMAPIRTAGIREYLVIYEKGETGWCAHAPDVPGCVAVGDTREEVEQRFKEALEGHLELMRESGETIPEPTTQAGLVSVAA